MSCGDTTAGRHSYIIHECRYVLQRQSTPAVSHSLEWHCGGARPSRAPLLVQCNSAGERRVDMLDTVTHPAAAISPGGGAAKASFSAASLIDSYCCWRDNGFATAKAPALGVARKVRDEDSVSAVLIAAAAARISFFAFKAATSCLSRAISSTSATSRKVCRLFRRPYITGRANIGRLQR